jgi:hypothetical protein
LKLINVLKTKWLFLRQNLSLIRPEIKSLIGEVKQNVKEEKGYLDRTSMNRAGAAAVGAAAGVIGMEGVHMLADEQVKICADQLKLTPDEVEMINAYKMTPKFGCDSIRLANPKDMLSSAKQVFGFVPTGICQMVLRENKVLDSMTDESIKASCSTIQSHSFETKKMSDGSEAFKCHPAGSDYTYSIPVGSNGQADFNSEKITAIVQKDGQTVSADSQAKEFAAAIQGIQYKAPPKEDSVFNEKIKLSKTEQASRTQDLRFSTYTYKTFEQGNLARLPDPAYCYVQSQVNRAVSTFRDSAEQCSADTVTNPSASSTK